MIALTEGRDMNNHPTINNGPRSVALVARRFLRARRPSPLVPRPSLPRGAFTLIELMVVMAIMAVLAAAMAYAVSGAQEAAQIAKTRSLIARLNTLVMQKYESYRYRRLPIVMPPGISPKQAAQVRCDVIRQLIRLEMPDRWTDVRDEPVKIMNPLSGVKDIVMQRPAVSHAYLASLSSVQNTPAFVKQGPEHQGAKCLYLLVTMGLDESDVLENFSEGDIADFDHTGCKVFLDAWGNPIEFLRWAPGLVSPLQPPTPTSAAEKDQRMPDQTDPTGVYGTPRFDAAAVNGSPRTEPLPGTSVTNWDTFALYPLVYSAGPDGHYDTVSDMTVSGTAVLKYSATSPPNNPFASIDQLTTNKFPDGPLGAPAIFPKTDRGGRALGNSDNIHNHSIGAR
jgi:prepilin-type N-terminal cleavage/methylation domain-containing protein